jgi:hypothetical protein
VFTIISVLLKPNFGFNPQEMEIKTYRYKKSGTEFFLKVKKPKIFTVRLVNRQQPGIETIIGAFSTLDIAKAYIKENWGLWKNDDTTRMEIDEDIDDYFLIESFVIDEYISVKDKPIEVNTTIDESGWIHPIKGLSINLECIETFPCQHTVIYKGKKKDMHFDEIQSLLTKLKLPLLDEH